MVEEALVAEVEDDSDVVVMEHCNASIDLFSIIV